MAFFSFYICCVCVLCFHRLVWCLCPQLKWGILSIAYGIMVWSTMSTLNMNLSSWFHFIILYNIQLSSLKKSGSMKKAWNYDRQLPAQQDTFPYQKKGQYIPFIVTFSLVCPNNFFHYFIFFGQTNNQTCLFSIGFIFHQYGHKISHILELQTTFFIGL